MPVYAYESTEQVEVDIFAIETEGYFPDRNQLYVISQSVGRTISLNGTIQLGATGSNFKALTNSSDSFTWKGNGRYNWLSTTLSSATTYIYGKVLSGGYIDFYSDDVYQALDGGTLTVDGSVRFWLKPVCYSVNDGSSVLPYDEENSVFPDKISVIANGQVFDTFNSSGSGTFDVNVSIDMADPITCLGFRFYFDSNTYAYYQDSNTVGKNMLFNIYDETSVLIDEPADETVPLIKEVIEHVKVLPATIYNFFFGEDGEDVADGFKSEVDDVTDEADRLQQEIEEGLAKPEPDTLVPDMDSVVDQDQFVAYTGVFGSILQSGSIIADMMFIVCALAMGSYVLFGKKG